MTLETPEDYYQAIDNELNPMTREPWSHMGAEVTLDETSVDIKVICFRMDDSRENDVDINVLPEYFYNLATAVSNEEKGVYKKRYFASSNDDGFNINFEHQYLN